MFFSFFLGLYADEVFVHGGYFLLVLNMRHSLERASGHLVFSRVNKANVKIFLLAGD